MSPWRQRVFPKKLMEWCEPPEFRRLLFLSWERTHPRWYRRRLLFLIFALLSVGAFGRWGIAEGDSSGRLAVAALGSFAVAWLLVYVVVPWLGRQPGTVGLFETGISRTAGNATRFWRFTDIAYCAWLPREGFSVLVLRCRSGREVFIGVPPGETVTRADALLREHGLAPQVDGAWPADHFPGAANK